MDETFKGDFQTVKGVCFTEVHMLGTLKRKEEQPHMSSTSSLEMPQLEVGQGYLLLTTRPSAIGMSSPVGLGQGCFRISGNGSGEEAVNAYGNTMLFRGMEAPGTRQAGGARQAGGPMKYSQLAEQIRRLVNEEGGKR